MSQLIEVMSDVDLLGMMVGSKTAARMLQDAGGRLSTLLNVCPTSYEPEPRVKTKLLVAKELVRRSLIETMLLWQRNWCGVLLWRRCASGMFWLHRKVCAITCA